MTPPDSQGLPASVKTRRASSPQELEDEDGLGALPTLDLELTGPISRGGIPSGYSPGQAFDEDDEPSLDLAGGAPPALKLRPDGAPQWPSGRTPDRTKLALDPLEIRLLAEYGAPPSLGFLTPIYALRVTLRKRALVRKLQSVESDLAEAEKRRDELLARLASQLRPELEQSKSFERVLSPLSEVEKLALERGSALLETSSEMAVELSRLEAERTRLAVDRSRLELRLAELIAAREAEEARYLRAEARYKRTFIEIRAIEQPAASRASGSSASLPAEAQARIAELKAHAETARPELESAKAAFDAALAQENAQRADVLVLERTLATVDRQGVSVRERYQRPLTARTRGVGEADAKLRSGLADVGRAVLAAGTGVTVDPGAVQALREADAEVLRFVKSSELHLRALDAFDASKVREGYTWLGSGTVLVLAYVAYNLFG